MCNVRSRVSGWLFKNFAIRSTSPVAFYMSNKIKQSASQKLKKNRTRHHLVQFAEYMIAGGAYFWVGYAAFFALDKGLHQGLFVATMVSNILGWTVNFLLQRYWVFKNPHARGHMAEATGKYVALTAVNFALNYVILAVLKQAGVTPYIGQFMSSGFFTVWNYLWYRFWVFPERYKKPKVMRSRVRR